MIEHYDPVNIFNCDETGLFYKLMPDRSLAVDRNDCRGGKKSKERYTVMLCANWDGSEKLKPVVIGELILIKCNSTVGFFLNYIVGKSAKPRCFKNVDMKKLPVQWYSNRTAWMNSKIFTEWLHEINLSMQKQERHILLFLDNAPVHPPDIQLDNIKLKFFPPNTTAKIQPMDQGIIRAFKAYYRRYLVKHIIASASTATTADDINVTALDAVHWIDSAWEAVTEATIRNTFRAAGFVRPSLIDSRDISETSSTNNHTTYADEKIIGELDQVLKYLTIGGRTMSAYDYVMSF
jgi:hypothetical protein